MSGYDGGSALKLLAVDLSRPLPQRRDRCQSLPTSNAAEGVVVCLLAGHRQHMYRQISRSTPRAEPASALPASHVLPGQGTGHARIGHAKNEAQDRQSRRTTQGEHAVEALLPGAQHREVDELRDDRWKQMSRM